MCSVAKGACFPDALEEVVKQAEEAVLLVVTLEGGIPQAVRGWRSITSSHELYLVWQSRQSLVLTDSFRAACSSLPVENRKVPERAIADHLLFRTAPGNHTYLTAARRLAQGERLELDVVAGKINSSRFEQLESTAERDHSHPAQLDAVEHALGQVISRCADDPNAVNLLSGGVDSTLIHTFLPRDFPAISTGIDTPEYAFEMKYARMASRLLEVEHEFISVKEADYVSLLEDSIRTLGLPPHHEQTVLFDAAFRSPYACFITGQFADGLFGLGVSRALSMVAMLPPALGLLAGRVKRAQRALRAAQRLRSPAGNPGSPAMGFAIYSEVDLVEKMIGSEAIQDSLRARLDYVMAICPFVRPEDTGLAAHLELGHLIDFFCDDAISLWRQLAHARQKRLHAPFITRSVVQSALAVPRAQRYVRRFQAKHLLKGSLARRLPSYPVNTRKGASGLPVRRFFSDGPLRGLLAEYDMPDFVPAELAETMLNGSGWLSWSCLTFAIWRDKVLLDPSLAPPSGTRIIRLPSTRDGLSASGDASCL
jgi:asparagine synthase (glutamine-hydrolysing)